MQRTVADVIASRPELSKFYEEIRKTAPRILDREELTVFAPINSAVIGDLTRAELLDHILLSEYNFKDIAKARNLDGIDVSANGLLGVNHAKIIQKDIIANNGIVHIVDDIIVKPRLRNAPLLANRRASSPKRATSPRASRPSVTVRRVPSRGRSPPRDPITGRFI